MTQKTYLAIWDKSAKTSTRICLTVFYVFLRTCDVIDWWFPVNAA
jgi:hypothetical protein